LGVAQIDAPWLPHKHQGVTAHRTQQRNNMAPPQNERSSVKAGVGEGLQSFRVNRNLPEGRYLLMKVFSGLEDVESLNAYVGNPTWLRRILEETEVMLSQDTGYMYVNDGDGSLVVGLEYLQTADVRYLYLDVIHELAHVKQYLDGRELFDENYSYVDRPTEVEAYQCTVKEARKIGMADDAIAEYLYVEWITRKEHARLLRTLGVVS
jgi:hypothetical protein